MSQSTENPHKEGETPPRAKEPFAERFLAKKGKRWLFLYALQVNVLAIFSVVVVFALQSYNTVQAAIVDAIGINIDVVLIIIVMWGVWLAYAITLLIRAIRKARKNLEITPRRINRVFPSFTTILFGGLAIGVNFINNSAITVSARILSFVGLLLLAETVVALVILAGPFVLHVQRMHTKFKDASIPHKQRIKSHGFLLVLGVYLVVILVPYLAMPANVLQGDLPAKPQFIAHRMGGFIGPENTIEGADAMRQFGVIGMEIDIRVSWDGIPFLLHDDVLTRTTNVADVFPTRANRPADNFTFTELRSLDAGSKFLSEPNGLFAQPYVNATTLEGYRGAKIASLAEAIAFCETWGWLIDANIKGVSEGHPNASNYLDNVLLMLNSSSIPALFIGGHLTDQTGAKIKHVTGDYEGNLANLKVQGYDIVGVDDLRTADATFRQIPAAGLASYTQFIDDPLTFSQMWCLGVTYIMTDTPYLFQGMTGPLWSMPVIWWEVICLAVQAVIGMSIIFAIVNQKKR